MPRFAPVAPLPILSALEKEDARAIGTYHLLLAHDVVKSEQSSVGYADLFRARLNPRFGARMQIIMDNSIVELGGAVDLETIKHAADIVRADCIVMPDVMGDGKATIELYKETVADPHYEEVRAAYQIMAVPQGPTIDKFLDCLDFFAAQEEPPEWIAVPRIATEQLGTRMMLAKLTRAKFPRANIHLLGFSDNIVDDILTVRDAQVQAMGIDSAVPIRAGSNGVQFQASRNDYGKRGDWWDTADKLTDDILANVYYYRQYIGESK